jgi:hypothetical protein
MPRTQQLRLWATTRMVRVAGVTTVVGVGQVWAAPAASAFPGEGIIRNAAGSAWEGITKALASWVLDAVGFFAQGVLHFLGTAAAPDVTGMWFAGPGSPFASVRLIAGVLLVGFALLAVLQGVMRGDVNMMFGRVLGGVPAAVLAIGAVTVITDKLVALTDALAAGVLDPTGPAAARFLSGFTLTTTMTGNGFAVVLVAVIAAVAGLALWAELLIRTALIYILIALSPLAFAAMVWPAARGTARRLTELLLAVIMSKLVIAVVLAIGVAAMGGVGLDASGGTGTQAAQGLGQLLVGAVLLGLAAFAPFLTLRLFPFAEAATVAHGVSRAPIRTAISALYLTNSATRLATVKTGGGAAGSADVIPAAVTATRAATAAFDLGRATTTPPSSGGGEEPR